MRIAFELMSFFLSFLWIVFLVGDLITKKEPSNLTLFLMVSMWFCEWKADKLKEENPT